MVFKHKNHSIATFDFDHTLIKKDSLFHFTTHCFGLKKMAVGILFLSPVMIIHRLGILSSGVAKSKFISYFFKRMNASEFQKKCETYSQEIDKNINKEAFAKLNWHKDQGHFIVIVSASIDCWIKPWAIKNGIDNVISTQIEITKGLLTGKLSTPNCKGDEKVKRFLDQYPAKEKYTLYAYGDSQGDKALLQISDYPFYRTFH